MLKKIFFSILMIIMLPGSCSFNQPTSQVFSEPGWIYQELAHNQKRIVIASTHNTQGSLVAENVEFRKTKNNHQLKIGGASVLKSYLKILKLRYKDSLLLLNTGSIFSLDRSIRKKRKILEVFKELQYDAISLTSTDFQALNILNPNSHEIPFVTSNIIDFKKNRPTSSHGISPYKIFNKNGVKIGIIALTSYSKSDKQRPKQLRGIYFEDPVLSFLKVKKIFKKRSVSITLLMTSFKNHFELEHFVKRLPPNSVDAIISGNPPPVKAEIIKEIQGIPLIQKRGQNHYINRIELIYDVENNTLLKDRTVLHRPIKVCHHFFKVTMDCHLTDQKKLRSQKIKAIANSQYIIVPARFLGHEIKQDNKIEGLINK